MSARLTLVLSGAALLVLGAGSHGVPTPAPVALDDTPLTMHRGTRHALTPGLRSRILTA